jgi:hypothetical protein
VPGGAGEQVAPGREGWAGEGHSAAIRLRDHRPAPVLFNAAGRQRKPMLRLVGVEHSCAEINGCIRTAFSSFCNPTLGWVSLVL